ncbi:hypothetical protein UNSWDHB_829 [Dehalobacter sp. UNSWDHB]|nr:hypothetical protein UNSWDHB_829 [Dehalobacter sp. UNSWDHB]
MIFTFMIGIYPALMAHAGTVFGILKLLAKMPSVALILTLKKKALYLATCGR